MPYGPVRETPKERALSNAERDRRISKIEAEQAERLRRAIGDEFFDFLAKYDEPMNEWLRRVKLKNENRN